MDFLAEYEEMKSIPIKTAVTYKFFDLFRVILKDTDENKKGIYWGARAVDTGLSEDVLGAFKAYLKWVKGQLKKGDPVNCGKALWFFYQKMLEHGVFDTDTRNEIRGFMDICEYIIL